MLPAGMKARLTLMVAPHDSGRVRHWVLPVWLLALTGIVVGGVVLSAAVIVWERADYASTRHKNVELEQRLSRYEAAVAEHRAALDRVSELEDRLKALVAPPSRRAILEQAPLPVTGDPLLGRGGPTTSAQNSLDFYLEMRREAARTQLERDLLQIEVDGRLRQDGYREIVRTISRQRSLLRATPSLWPARGYVSSNFGMRDSPTRSGRHLHAGVDIAGRPGERIHAAADGVAVFAGWGQEMGGYGKIVVVDHGFGYQTRYAHNQELLVSVGQKIRRGQVIAYMGSTGESTGPHLHYEVRLHGRALDPLRFGRPLRTLDERRD